MDNRSNILEHALLLFAERGYDAVGVQEIASASEVTKPTLYHYFGSKYGLLEAVVTAYFEPFMERLRSTAVYRGDIPGVLCAVAWMYMDFSGNNEAFYRLMMALMYSAEQSDGYRAIEGYMCEQYVIMRDFFGAAGGQLGNMRGRQRQYALGFSGLLNHYMMYYYLEPEKERAALTRQEAYEIVHQFLHGIYV